MCWGPCVKSFKEIDMLFDPAIPQVKSKFSHKHMYYNWKKMEITAIPNNRGVFEYTIVIYLIENTIPINKWWYC